MKPLTAKDVERILGANGFVLDRIRGSHHIWVNDSRFASIAVPMHGNRTLPQGTLLAIFRQAGLAKPQR